MCYSPRMDRIPIRELRNQASRVVRRARAGERLVITVDGVPAAQIGPVTAEDDDSTLQALVAQGRLLAPRSTEAPTSPSPIRLSGPGSSTDVLDELRAR